MGEARRGGRGRRILGGLLINHYSLIGELQVQWESLFQQTSGEGLRQVWCHPLTSVDICTHCTHMHTHTQEHMHMHMDIYTHTQTDRHIGSTV